MSKKETVEDIDWVKFEREIREDYKNYQEWDADLGLDFPYEYNPYHESVLRLSFVLDYLEDKDYEKALEMAVLEYGEGGLWWAMKEN